MAMQTNMNDSKVIVYKDNNITIVKAPYGIGNWLLWRKTGLQFGNQLVVNKGMTRYWLFNYDMSVMYSLTSGLYDKEFGFKLITVLKGNVIKAEFTDNTIFLFDSYNKQFRHGCFSDVSDFVDGFAIVKKFGYSCYIDTFCNLFITNSKKERIILPDKYLIGAIIDDDHLALYEQSMSLFDGNFQPITINNSKEGSNIYFSSFEKGPAEWCVKLRDCSIRLINSNSWEREHHSFCVLNLSTNNICYTSHKKDDEFAFTPIGDSCIHQTIVVKEEKREWDSNDRKYYTITNDFVKETLYFKKGSSLIDYYGRIQLLPDMQLILISGGKFIINNCQHKTNSGCFTFSGEKIIPFIYPELTLKDGLFEAKRGTHTYRLNLHGELLYKEKPLPKEINLFDDLGNDILLVRHCLYDGYTEGFTAGIYDTNAEKYILPLVYSSISKANNNTYIVCQNDKKYGLLNNQFQFQIPCKYDSLEHITNDLYICSIKENDYHTFYYVVDKTDNNVLSSKFSHINIIETNRLCFESIHDVHYRTRINITDFEFNTIFTLDNGETIKMNGFWDLSGGFAKDYSPFVGRDNNWGIVNKESVIVTNNHYDLIENIGISNVFIGIMGKSYYLINPIHQIENQIDCDSYFTREEFYNPGCIGISKKHMCGLMDSKGNMLFGCKYSEINVYKTEANCLKVVTYDKSRNRRIGLISNNGQLKRKDDLCFIGKFVSGKALANIGGKLFVRYNSDEEKKDIYIKGGSYGIINEDGKYVIDPIYNYIGIECEGYRSVCRKIGSLNKFGLIKAEGTSVIDCKYSYIRNVVNGMIVFAKGGIWSTIGREDEKIKIQLKKNDHFLHHAKWGISDTNGNIISEPFADFMQAISEGKVTYKINGKYGIIDLYTGTKKLTDYDYLSSFHEGRCIAGKYDSNHSLRYGFIKDDYSELIPCEYDKAYPFHDGKAYLDEEDAQYTIDLDGKTIHCFVDMPDFDDHSDWERDNWNALTDGQYGDMPDNFDGDYDRFGF